MSEMRVSTAERDEYLSALADSYADGRLDDAEHERRRDAILSGVTHQDMLAQFRDLPAPQVGKELATRSSGFSLEQVRPLVKLGIGAVIVLLVIGFGFVIAEEVLDIF